MLIIKKFHKFLPLAVASAFCLQGCVTIISGTSKQIPVTSTPLGAQILVDGKVSGVTPVLLKLAKGKDHLIRIEKEGYNPLEIRIKSKVSESLGFSILGNALVLGTAGAVPGLLVATSGLLLFQPKIINDAAPWVGLGFIAGTMLGVLIDSLSGSFFTLSPDNLVLTLTKVEGQPQAEIVVLDSERFQSAKWIRIFFQENKNFNRENDLIF